jgi:hypothetical protein
LSIKYRSWFPHQPEKTPAAGTSRCGKSSKLGKGAEREPAPRLAVDTECVLRGEATLEDGVAPDEGWAAALIIVTDTETPRINTHPTAANTFATPSGSVPSLLCREQELDAGSRNRSALPCISDWIERLRFCAALMHRANMFSQPGSRDPARLCRLSVRRERAESVKP